MANQSLNLRHATLLIAGAVLIAAITATTIHAQQPPPWPQTFYGSVEVNGQPAAVGAQIEARGAGVKVGIQGNPLSVTVARRYGGPTLAEPKLGVQGNIPAGTPIEFYVDGVKAECARPGGQWQSSYLFAAGVVTELNLRVGQNATPTATPTSTPLPTAIGASPIAGATDTPEPTQTAVRATRTPRSTTPTPAVASGAANVTPQAQDTPQALSSVTPIATGNATIALASPTPTSSSATKGGAAPAQASPASAAGNVAAATAPASATPEPAKSEGAAAPLASAAQTASTRPPTLIARVTAGPRGTSTPILGSGTTANAVPAAGAAVTAASSGAMSFALPWAGAGLLLLALGLAGILIVFRLRKSGRAGRDSAEQP